MMDFWKLTFEIQGQKQTEWYPSKERCDQRTVEMRYRIKNVEIKSFLVDETKKSDFLALLNAR